MNQLISIVQYISNNGQVILSAVMGLLTAVIGIALLIPGEQPEKSLQAVVDFLSKFSRKPEQK